MVRKKNAPGCNCCEAVCAAACWVDYVDQNTTQNVTAVDFTLTNIPSTVVVWKFQGLFTEKWTINSGTDEFGVTQDGADQLNGTYLREINTGTCEWPALVERFTTRGSSEIYYQGTLQGTTSPQRLFIWLDFYPFFQSGLNDQDSELHHIRTALTVASAFGTPRNPIDGTEIPGGDWLHSIKPEAAGMDTCGTSNLEWKIDPPAFAGSSTTYGTGSTAVSS